MAPSTKDKFVSKVHLIEHMSKTMDKLKVSKTDMKKIVDELFGFIKTNITKGVPVRISGFGGWSAGVRKARLGTNPMTHEKIKIPETKTVKFKAARQFKGEMNG